MNNIYHCFPGGKHKALTFSYDDGRIFDKRLIEIFNKNGMKGTFNLNAGRFIPRALSTTRPTESNPNYFNFNGGTLKLLADAEFHDLEMPDAADKLDLNGFKLSLRSPTHQNTGWTGQIVDSSLGKTGRIEWVRSGFVLMIK